MWKKGLSILVWLLIFEAQQGGGLFIRHKELVTQLYLLPVRALFPKIGAYQKVIVE